MKVLIATDKPFAAAAVEGIRTVIDKAGFELVILEKYTSKQQLIEAVKDVDAMIVRSDIVDSDVINAADKLKIVVRAGAGYDNLDLVCCTNKQIVAMNTPGQNANAVAELTFGMMLLMARNRFNGTSGTELKDKTIGIHAFGNVGRNVARIAKGFGMKVYAFDEYCPKEVIEKEGVTVCANVQELYSKSHYVSINIPLTPQTNKLIGKELLELMPKNGVLVNTARKEVVNEEELIVHMTENTKFKYASDIAPATMNVFMDKFEDRVFFTLKKMGAQTEEANTNAGIAAACQIVGYLKEGIDTFRVN
ncbi:MAG: NAD(P)-dependent oxidoreductase [Bacteroidales bacterium]